MTGSTEGMVALFRHVSLTVLTCLSVSAHAAPEQALRFAHIFASNMVLQQNKPAGVWGWAPPGAALSVTIEEYELEQPAASGVPGSIAYRNNSPSAFRAVTLTAAADEDGAWRVNFPAMPASFNGKRITVTDQKGGSVRIENVLIGEVWVCSGQSNMRWSGASNAELWRDGLQLHGIRYTQYDFAWPRPLDDLPKAIDWEVTTSKTIGAFAKVPYVFARNLHLNLGVPIGIINNARGGTRGVSWTSMEALKSIQAPMVVKEVTEYEAKVVEWESPEALARLDKARHDVVNVWRPRARKEIAAHWEQYDRFMKEHLTGDQYAEWQQMAADWALAIEEKHNAPGTIPSWKVWGLEKKARKLFQGTDTKAPEMDRGLWKDRPDDKDPREGWSPPAGLFNAGVVPLKDMAVAGVLYYQGENENFGPLDNLKGYVHIFPKVISAHRDLFGNDQLPFGIISLAGWGKHGTFAEEGASSRWPYIMDVHAQTHLRTPQTGLITIHDLGHASIHPPDKQPVGQRAARWALGAVYGRDVTYRPTLSYKGIETRDNRILVRFEDDDGKGAIPPTFEGGPHYRGFAVAGEDRRWHAAQVEANNREQDLAVWSGAVPAPVAVRYAWSRFSDGNLGNRTAPIPLFRSDDWPLPEDGK